MFFILRFWLITLDLYASRVFWLHGGFLTDEHVSNIMRTLCIWLEIWLITLDLNVRTSWLHAGGFLTHEHVSSIMRTQWILLEIWCIFFYFKRSPLCGILLSSILLYCCVFRTGAFLILCSFNANGDSCGII